MKITGKGSRAKNKYNKEVDLYKWFVVDLENKKAVSGFEFKEDANDLLSDYDGDKNFKVVSKITLPKLGIETPTSEWKYEGGGEIQSKIDKLQKVADSSMLPESVKDKAKAEIERLKAELALDRSASNKNYSFSDKTKLYISEFPKGLIKDVEKFTIEYKLTEDEVLKMLMGVKQGQLHVLNSGRAFTTFSNLEGDKQKAVKEIIDFVKSDKAFKYKKASYKLGDQWKTDFDTKGLLEYSLKVDENTPIKTLEKLHSSYEDNNIHTTGSPLWDAVIDLRQGNKDKAKLNILKFKQRVEEDLVDEFGWKKPTTAKKETPSTKEVIGYGIVDNISGEIVASKKTLLELMEASKKLEKRKGFEDMGNLVYEIIKVDGKNVVGDKVTSVNINLMDLDKGGLKSVDKIKLEKELHKLQRDLNSKRLLTYTESDNSEEEKERQKERETKLARFNEVLALLNKEEKSVAPKDKTSQSERLLETLKEKGKLKRYYLPNGSHKKTFETIIPSKIEDNVWNVYRSQSRNVIGEALIIGLNEKELISYFEGQSEEKKYTELTHSYDTIKVSKGKEYPVSIWIDEKGKEYVTGQKHSEKVVKTENTLLSGFNELTETEKDKFKTPSAPKPSHKALVAKLKAKKGEGNNNRGDLVSYKDGSEERRSRSESSDKKRNAKPLGKRISENGLVYYENRLNRADKSPKKKFEGGGEIGKDKSSWGLDIFKL